MKTKIAIIGESCQDEYVYGTCNRVCPEAAALCFTHSNKKTINQGMAGNVFANLQKLDINNQLDITLISPKTTIIKRRFIDIKYNTILFREDINDSCERINIKEYNLEQYSYILFSDYNKGYLTEQDIISICSKYKDNAIIFIDTKKRLKNIYEYIDFIKINSLEFLSNKEDFEIIQSKTKLIVTQGELGATFYYKDKSTQYPTKNIELRDVCGAGDTFFAALVYNYIHTRNIDSSIRFANECSSIVVSKFGVATV